jgi:predicted regulator of Ras-like GTPase activity (Roadblock/LC7/MglB family)
MRLTTAGDAIAPPAGRPGRDEAMSAPQFNALYAALGEGLASVRSAGGFQSIALADSRGLAWAADGDIPTPDHFAAIPSLIARAFADRQPLLRYYSDKRMRFEYRSDTLAYIKCGLTGENAEATYHLDVPGDKEAVDANEFVVGWDSAHLVLRHIPVGSETWRLLGVTSNPTAGRAALAKAAPGLASLLEAAGDGTRLLEHARPEADSLQGRLIAAMEVFRSSAPDILMAAVTSKDGFVVAALEGGDVDAEMVAPLMGHSFLAIQESTQRLCGATESAMLRMEHGVLLSRQLSDDLLFAALLGPSACTGLILSTFETAADALRCALDTLTVAVAAPQIQEVAA